MSKKRFHDIKRYFHIADNQNLANSKMAKIFPLLEKLKTNCQQFEIFHQFLSIGESMIPYRGLHSAKQFIKGKPVKFEFKMWVLCSADGFLLVKREPERLIDQPFIIKMYNEGMGGVDVCDRLLSSYTPRLRSKKWWWNLFSNLLNLSVVASFRFYNFINQTNVTHLKFRREIATSLVRSRLRLGRPSAQPSPSVRFDGANHILNATS